MTYFDIKILIIFTLIIYITLLTPQFLSDFFYGVFNPKVTFVYKNKDNKFIKYEFNHTHYDGSRIQTNIKHKMIKPLKNNYPIYQYKPYHYLNSNRIHTYSIFTSTIARFIKHSLDHKKRKIKVCIIVSIRDSNNIGDNTRGNFLKLAYYTIYPNDTLDDICKKHHTSIKHTKYKQYLKKNTTLYELIKAFSNVNYIFNDHKALSSINTIHNEQLTKQLTYKITKKDVDKLIITSKTVLVQLSFINNSYLISKVSYLFNPLHV
jgi:hypothetical protein